MSSFYTNIFQRGDKIYVRGYENGNLVEKIENYKPYLFIPKKGGKYKSLEGNELDKIKFDSIYEAKDFIKTYDDVSGFEIYGLTDYKYMYIFDNYPGEIKYDTSLISVGSIDIETKADSGFPDISKADKEITAITIRKNNKSFVFSCVDYTAHNDSVYYIKCKNESELLIRFIDSWKHLKFDVITGWNIEFFDIPYLVNRITKVLGKKEAEKLSPWGIIEEKTVEVRNRENQTYNIIGISTLDYYQLYRKFKFGNQESYKLSYIAQEEGVGDKIAFDGTLDNLYETNPQKYIEYNIHDAVLVDKLNDKLGFIEQVFAFAYDAKVNYNDTMTTVRPWDVIIHNYLLEQNICIPQFHKQQMFDSLVGGYVKEPKIGLSKWVVSFDLTSLYPHLITAYNISPETFIERIPNFTSVEQILEGNYKNQTEYSITANGCVYRKDKQGFLPILMEKMYNDRSVYKVKMLEAKKEYEKTNNPELVNEISRYHNLQLAKKIMLNSLYGSLANQYCRWFSFDNAEAITLSGQLSIRWIEKKINEYMNNMMKTKDIDYIVASDTDSVYITFESMIKSSELTDEKVIVKAINEFCESKIQPYIEKCYLELSKVMNMYKQSMFMKRETIANKGIWKAKKMYILNAWDVEGVTYDTPKLKMQGIEAVRSSTPHACRKAIKESISIIMNGTEEELRAYVSKFREKFSKLSFEEVASPRGINGMKKYYDPKTIYIKGTPLQVKGALLFNNLLKKHNIKNIPPIQDGDKIKYAYLKLPNPIHDTVIATLDIIPKEFNLDKYIDRDIQFSKTFLEPVKSITEVISWQPEYVSTLEDFFN